MCIRDRYDGVCDFKCLRRNSAGNSSYTAVSVYAGLLRVWTVQDRIKNAWCNVCGEMCIRDRVESDKSTFVEYNGKPLKSLSDYNWTVEVTVNNGEKAAAYSSLSLIHI